MHKNWLITGALLGALAVILGAYGAHGLRMAFHNPELGLAASDTFDTAARYQMYHVFAILACGILGKLYGHNGLLNVCGWLFIAGIVLFSGSLYLLSTRSLLGIESWTWLGPVTPLGGLCFVGGWITLAIAVVRMKTSTL